MAESMFRDGHHRGVWQSCFLTLLIVFPEPEPIHREFDAPTGKRTRGSIDLRQTSRKRATIVIMFLALFAMRLLECLFFAGLAGSAVVIIISFIEDGKELFGKDDVNE